MFVVIWEFLNRSMFEYPIEKGGIYEYVLG